MHKACHRSHMCRANGKRIEGSALTMYCSAAICLLRNASCSQQVLYGKSPVRNAYTRNGINRVVIQIRHLKEAAKSLMAGVQFQDEAKERRT
jgi:hypothetical protein